jgi:DNA-binding NarL/FixJ family response regulator
MSTESRTVETRILVIHPAPMLAHGLVTQLELRGYQTTMAPDDEHDAALVAISDLSWEYDHPTKRIAILDTPDPAAYRMAYAMGAAGVITVTQHLPEIIRCVDGALNGTPTVPIDVLRFLTASTETRSHPILDLGLDAIDIRILQLRSAGVSIAKIAADVGFSEHTISNKLQRLCRKLGVDNNSQAITRASAWGLLDN